MNDLLNFAVEAHGGLKRWSQLSRESQRLHHRGALAAQSSDRGSRFPANLSGQDEISGIFQFVRDLYPGLEFGDLQILIDTPNQVLAEYEFTAPLSDSL
jgi:hypothetical protein